MPNFNKHTKKCVGEKKKNKYSEFGKNLDNGKIKCIICKKICSKFGFINHYYYNHTIEGVERRRISKNNISQRYKNGELTVWNKNRTKDVDSRVLKISNSMKKAHEEGRASNIGYRKHLGLPSYPEEFFMKVIKNEFNDKNYEYNKQFYKYKIDFAWENKKRAIEIDGSQHERYANIKISDIKKDVLLKQYGWDVLRIKWKDMFNNTKKWIKIAKKFIDS